MSDNNFQWNSTFVLFTLLLKAILSFGGYSLIACRFSVVVLWKRDVYDEYSYSEMISGDFLVRRFSTFNLVVATACSCTHLYTLPCICFVRFWLGLFTELCVCVRFYITIRLCRRNRTIDMVASSHDIYKTIWWGEVWGKHVSSSFEFYVKCFYAYEPSNNNQRNALFNLSRRRHQFTTLTFTHSQSGIRTVYTTNSMIFS